MIPWRPIPVGGDARKMSYPPMSGLLKWIIAGCMTLCLHSPALSLNIESDRQFSYADTLFNNRQFLRAAEEYQRFAFFFPEHPLNRKAIFRSGEAFYLAEDPGRAIEQLKSLTDVQPLDELAVEAFFKMSECYLALNSPTHAVVQLNNVIALSDDPGVIDRAYYRIGWIHIELADWIGAQMAFTKLSPPGTRRYGLDQLQTALSQNAAIPAKSPLLAGSLSILPGAGQLYCNRYEDALIAFVVNIGLIWAAVDAFDNEQYGLGGLLSFVGLGFYAGNIYGAVNDAHKYNQLQTRQFVDGLRQYQVHVPGPTQKDAAAGKGLILSLKIPF